MAEHPSRQGNVVPMSEAQKSAKVRSAPEPSSAVVLLGSVTVESRGKPLLNGLTLALPQGGINAIMGPNGAGKSLMLRVMAGLIQPKTGFVQIAPNVVGRTALVFQRPVLLRRSVRANLYHALRVHGVKRAERAKRLEILLAEGGLASLADAPARQLSGGEQQRLQLVRALAGSPRLLLLDEPTASLDPQSTLAIETLVRRAREDGCTVVMVTHDHGQAQRLSDRVVFVHQGQVAETTPTDSFFDRPQSEMARGFLDGRLLL